MNNNNNTYQGNSSSSGQIDLQTLTFVLFLVQLILNTFFRLFIESLKLVKKSTCGKNVLEFQKLDAVISPTNKISQISIPQ